MIQDLTDYYKEQGKTYHDDFHRMPPGTPNRDYARHDVHILPAHSHLREIVGADELKNVSSWHHQPSAASPERIWSRRQKPPTTAFPSSKGWNIPRTPYGGSPVPSGNDLKQVLINKKTPKTTATPKCP